MSMTEEQVSEHVEIDRKIAGLEEDLRRISPEVVSGDGKAKSRALALREEIDSLKLKRELASFAADEEQRRASEAAAKADLERREKARTDYATELAEVIALEKKIGSLTEKLTTACTEHKSKVRRLGALAIRAHAPGFNPGTTQRFERDLDGFLRSCLQEFIQNLKGTGKEGTPLHERHASILKRVKDSLATPLEPRKLRDEPKPERESRPALFFRAPRPPLSIFIDNDGQVFEADAASTEGPNRERIRNRRTAFFGGYDWTEVKPEDVEPLLAAGYGLRKGFVLPSTAYELSTEVEKRGASS